MPTSHLFVCFIIFVLVCNIVQSEKQNKLAATFYPKFSGGVSGEIYAIYQKKNPLKTKIHVDMDISNLDMKSIEEKYPKCKYPLIEFKWHIHVKWNNQEDSGFLSDCSPANTGGHYDIHFACGSASQFSKHSICQQKNQTYACSPASFQSNPFSCEVGDLSGKFGTLRKNDQGKLIGSYTDPYFAPISLFNQEMIEHPNVEWNFILHASCPEEKNPRVLCAKALISYSSNLEC